MDTVDGKAALSMPVANSWYSPCSAYTELAQYDLKSLRSIAESLRKLEENPAKPRCLGICGTLKLYELVPVLAASFPGTRYPGAALPLPLPRHIPGSPWSTERRRLARHCLDLIETFLAETAPSKSYKPAHGGYPCSA